MKIHGIKITPFELIYIPILLCIIGVFTGHFGYAVYTSVVLIALWLNAFIFTHYKYYEDEK